MKKNTQAKVRQFQQTITEKIAFMQKEIIKKVLSTILESPSLTPEAFVERYSSLQIPVLPKMSESNRKFLKKTMESVYNEIDKIPTLSQSFEMLADFTNNVNIKKEFIEKIALPHALTFIAEVNNLKKSFIQRT